MALSAAPNDGGSMAIEDMTALAKPMHDVISDVVKQLAELQRYKTRYGQIE
jgi:hypothetical protein